MATEAMGVRLGSDRLSAPVVRENGRIEARCVAFRDRVTIGTGNRPAPIGTWRGILAYGYAKKETRFHRPDIAALLIHRRNFR